MKECSQTLKKNRANTRIVVIGAGSAGIALATRLLENGFENVLILEAENRIGGRINTQAFGENVIDLGAQWCHGEKNNVVYQRVKDLNILDTTGDKYFDYKCVRSNREVIDDKVVTVLKSLGYGSVPRHQADLVNSKGSLGINLTERFWQAVNQSSDLKLDLTIAKEFLENLKKFQSYLKASDNLYEVSGRGHLEYKLCEGNLHLNWRDKGYRSFLNVIMKAKSPEDLGMLSNSVLLNRRVKNVDWSYPKHILVRLWNGEIIEADHVVCTVSLGVLKENYRTMFIPMLPPVNCRSIEGLSMGVIGKFFLEFAESLGPKEWSGFYLLWLDEDLTELRDSQYFWLESVFGFYRVPHQPRLLLGWIVGEHARYMETLPEIEVQIGIMWLLRKFLNFSVPEPLNFRRTQWFTNPNFRGSLSFRSMLTHQFNTGAWDLAQPVTDTNGRPVLQFAGEATHAQYFSTVHGAVESGYREAIRLIEFYSE